jgi:hypothetical protein
MSDNKKVEAEMQAFLDALASYPERFATDPQLTFEQHQSSLATAAFATPVAVEPVPTRDKRARSAAASS